MALDKDTLLLEAFIKVQKIGKGLKSNGISNKAGFFRHRQTEICCSDYIIIIICFDDTKFYTIATKSKTKRSDQTT